MKTIPSSEFRKTYSQITEPVVVTVMGHPIGEWKPYVLTPQLRSETIHLDNLEARPFRPVPKPRKR